MGAPSLSAFSDVTHKVQPFDMTINVDLLKQPTVNRAKSSRVLSDGVTAYLLYNGSATYI